MALDATHRTLGRISRVAAIVGGLGIIFISFMITIDVFLRKFFGTTLGGASEISGMVFAVATAMAYPYVLLDRAHIRIDVVYSRLTPKVRAILDLAAMLIMLAFSARLALSTFELLQKSWAGSTRTIGVVNIPIWIPQSLWVIGLALAALTALFLSVYAGIGLYRRNWSAVNRVAGVPSIEETIEEETHIEMHHEDDGTASSDNVDDR